MTSLGWGIVNVQLLVGTRRPGLGRELPRNKGQGRFDQQRVRHHLVRRYIMKLATTTMLVLLCTFAFAQEIPRAAQRVPGVFAHDDAGRPIVVVPESARIG